MGCAVPVLLLACLSCGGIAQGTEDEGEPFVKPATAPSAATTLYLNFDGAHLQFSGKNDAAAGVTTLGDGPGPYQIAPTNLNRYVDAAAPSRAAVIEQIARQVRAVYQPFDLDVVTERPASGQFTMLSVGDTFNDIHFDETCPLAGLAVRDCDGQHAGDVGFAAAGCVSELYDSAAARRVLARTIAHEAGHTFGLTHNENESSVMAPASEGLALSAGAVPPEDQASCGRTNQNDFAVLQRVLGLRQ